MVTNNENVDHPRSKRPIVRILDMNNIMSTQMPLPPLDRPHPPNIPTPSNHAHRTDIKLQEVRHLVVFQIKLDGVVGPDERVWVPDRSSVVRNDVGDASETERDALDFEELVFGFFGCDAVDRESAFDVVEDTEVFVGLFDRDDVHEAGRVCRIRTDFIIHLDEPLTNDDFDFTSIQSIF